MAINPSLAYFFPCALIEDFSFAKLSDTITTEVKNKWSTTDNTELPISLDDVYLKNNRRSLKLAYASASPRQYAYRGDDGVDYDHSSWNNPYASDDDDGSWADNIGLWVYAVDHDQADDADLLSVGYGYASGSLEGTNWNTSVSETGKWKWMDVVVDMSNTDIEKFYVGVYSVAASGTLYVNGMTLFKRSTSNREVNVDSDGGSTTSATGLFNWQNGLAILVTGVQRTVFGYSVTGILDPKYYRQSTEQLQAMQTINTISQPILKMPMPKFTSISDNGYLKTYLFYTKFTAIGETTEEFIADPVVITDVSLSHVAGKPNIVSVTMNLRRFSGV